MAENEYWEQFGEAEWQDFARKWLAEIRNNLPDGESETGQAVVSMNFTAPLRFNGSLF